jgi:hypothetical protein
MLAGRMNRANTDSCFVYYIICNACFSPQPRGLGAVGPNTSGLYYALIPRVTQARVTPGDFTKIVAIVMV